MFRWGTLRGGGDGGAAGFGGIGVGVIGVGIEVVVPGFGEEGFFVDLLAAFGAEEEVVGGFDVDGDGGFADGGEAGEEVGRAFELGEVAIGLGGAGGGCGLGAAGGEEGEEAIFAVDEGAVDGGDVVEGLGAEVGWGWGVSGHDGGPGWAGMRARPGETAGGRRGSGDGVNHTRI